MRAGVVLLIAACCSSIVGLPLWSLLSKSFQDRDGKFVGLANYVPYFSTPALFDSALEQPSCRGGVAPLIVVPLAFVYAYALHAHRACRCAGCSRRIALIPIFAPSLLPGHLAHLPVRQPGLPQGLLLGGPIYGSDGIVIAQVFYCFPHATDDPGDRAADRRRAALRGGRRAGRLASCACSSPSRCPAPSTA